MSNRNSDVPGNPVSSAALMDREMLKRARWLYLVSSYCEREGEQDIRIRSIRIKVPEGGRGEYLGVVTADTETASLVAFHVGDDLVGCLSGLCTRIMNGSLKWREDEFRSR